MIASVPVDDDIDAGLDIRIARLSDSADAAVLMPTSALTMPQWSGSVHWL